MSLSHITIIDFPQQQESELRIQLGKLLPNTLIEALTASQSKRIESEDNLIFVWDSMTSLSLVRRLFETTPQANIVILTDCGNSDRAADLIHMGVIDYRQMPLPSDALEIYIRKSGHQRALAQQAKAQQPTAADTKNVFVTHDIATRRLLDRVALIAPSNASVLVIGESGTGKERLSRFVHACSNRSNENFIAVNCAAIPEGVMESELFGHEKGAFTGATGARPGKFELAHDGTLLLDEITEMPIHLQAKLLRVLQEGEVDRLGGTKPVKINVRVIATSNRDISKSVQEGSFRQDLYYRLNVVTIQLPPLRERKSDIAPLAKHFLLRFSDMYKRPAPSLSNEAADRLQHYPWPGNARELENCMHRAFLMAIDEQIKAEHLCLEMLSPQSATDMQQNGDAVEAGVTIRDMERVLIEKTLVHVKGNRTEAAELLGISIRTLRNKLHTYESGMSLAD
ncbi:MAG: sigma-54 dependent transcriptional regulator [Mariprofundus sp.]|nr:sigma-54 dependent transcriptional regulator [Mariprofundus sp.]